MMNIILAEVQTKNVSRVFLKKNFLRSFFKKEFKLEF